MKNILPYVVFMAFMFSCKNEDDRNKIIEIEAFTKCFFLKNEAHPVIFEKNNYVLLHFQNEIKWETTMFENADYSDLQLKYIKMFVDNIDKKGYRLPPLDNYNLNIPSYDLGPSLSLPSKDSIIGNGTNRLMPTDCD